MFILDPTNEASFEIIGSNTSLVANFGSTTDNVYVRFFGNDPASNVGFLLGASNISPSQPTFLLGEIQGDGEGVAPDFTIAGGNIGIGTSLATEKLMVVGNIVPGACNIFDLGSTHLRWRDLYLSGSTIDLDGLRLTQNGSGDLVLNDRNSTLKRVVVSELQIGDSLRLRDSGAGIVEFVSVDGNVQTPINPIEYYGMTGNVGLGTTIPEEKLHVVGNVLITGSISAANLAPSATQDTTNATNITSGTLSIARLPVSGVMEGSYGSASTVPQVTIDPYGRVTSATSTPIVVASTRITGLVASATTDTTDAANITSGTLSLGRFATSGVSSGTYGTSSDVSQIVVDPYGRVTTANNVPIVITSSRVTGLVSSATIDTTSATNITSGTLSPARLPVTSVTAGTYGNSTTVPQVTIDPYGRVTTATDVAIAIPYTAVSGLATVATTGNYNDLSNKTFVLNGASAYFDGDVGIGLSQPTEKLHVMGNIYSSGTITASNLIIVDKFTTVDTVTSNTDQLYITNMGSGPALKVVQTGVSPVAEFYDDGQIALLVADGGYVGIGTGAPVEKLSVFGNAHISGSISAANLANSAFTDTTDATNITSGTLSLARMPTSGVIAGTYGIASKVATISVDPYGRVTTASEQDIVISSAYVTGLVSSATIDTTNAANITSGTLSLARVPTSGVTSGTYGNATNIPILTIDPYGRVTSASTSLVYTDASRVSGLASVATTGNYNDLANQPFVNGTNNRVTTTANIGIGTVSPAALLHVQRTGSGDVLRVDDQPGTDTTPFIIKQDGNVGIGLTSPTASLHVAGSIRNDTLTASRVIVTNNDKHLVTSTVTTTEVDYLSGVTSSIQTQLNSKQATITGAATTIVSSDLTSDRVLVATNLGKVGVSTVTTEKLGYLSDVTSPIQSQLNDKLSISSGGSIQGSVSVNGTLTTSNLAVLGSTTTINSYTIENSNVVISNLNGTGAALSITQKTILGNGTILECFDTDISTSIPVFTVADAGRVGVNTSLPTHTMHVEGDLKFTGSLVGALNASSIASGTINATYLPLSGATAGGYGSPSNIPILQVDDKGRITSISTAQVDIISDYNDLLNTPFVASGPTTVVTASNVTVGGNLHIEKGLTLGSNASMTTSYFQLSPTTCNVIVTAASQSVFNVRVPGLVVAKGSNIDVFRNGIKLYFSSNAYEYDITSSFDYTASNTAFQVSLARAANYGDMVDITVWPQLQQTQTQDPGRVFQYINVSDAVWSQTGVSQISYTGNVGIGLSQPTYQLQLSLDSAAKPTTNTWTATSDARIKEDIQFADLDRCYEVVKELPLKRFRWSPTFMPSVSDRHMLGWIAQEVETMIPNAVSYSSSYGFSDMRGLDSDQIIKFMYGALQKTMTKIEILEQEVQSLKQQLNNN